MLFQTVLVALAASAQAPWDGAPFQGDPAAILRAAAALSPPGKSDVDVILEETRFDLDAQGRSIFTYHSVFRPLTRDAAERMRVVDLHWFPWMQERPMIRARVIDAAGEPHLLNAATLTEDGVGNPSARRFSDEKILRGPLPAMDAGAVAEVLMVRHDTAPVFDAGSSFRFFAARLDLPVRCKRFRVTAPPGLPLTWRAAGGDLGQPRELQEDGRRMLSWEWRNVEQAPPVEAEAPPELPIAPRLDLTTAVSWHALAIRYAELLEQQLAGEDLRAIASGLVTQGEPAEAAAQKLLDWISARVHYGSMEGLSSLVPARPREVIERRYGDCKDLALLLTGLLRAAGYPASLALLNSGQDEVDPALPSLGVFTHAIVYLPGSRRLFIDPTASTIPVGELPAMDAGRLALIVSAETDRLTQIPWTRAADNSDVWEREVVLSELGLARVVETTTSRGASATRFRDQRRSDPTLTEKQSRLDAELALRWLDAKRVVSVTVDGAARTDRPITIRREVLDSSLGYTEEEDAKAVVTPGSLFGRLPDFLLPPKEKTGSEAGAVPTHRRSPFFIREPFSATMRYRVLPPPGFRAQPLPAGAKKVWGPVQFDSSYSEDHKGVVTASFHLRLEGRSLAASDARAIRDEIARFLEAPAPRVEFRRLGFALLEQGKGREALDELRRLCELYPTDARHRALLAKALVRLHLFEAARREARRAVELGPDTPSAHRILAAALASSAPGRGLSCDRPGFIAAMRRLVALEPTASTRGMLARALTLGEQCVQYGPGAQLAEAIALFASVRAELQSTDFDGPHLDALLADGRFHAARALAGAMEPGPKRSAALLAAAALDGEEAVRREEREVPSQDWTAAFRGARSALLRHRNYPAVATLIRAASLGRKGPPQPAGEAAMLQKIRRHEEIPMRDGDAASLVHQINRLASSADWPMNLEPLLYRSPLVAKDDLRAAAGALPLKPRWLRELPDSTRLDLVESNTEVSVEGDPAIGVRIRVRSPRSDTLGDFWSWQIHALPQDGKLRLVLIKGSTILANAARLRAHSGDQVAASRLLALAREAPGSSGDELARRWSHGATDGDPQLEAAAAAEEALGSPEPIPYLRDCYKTASTDLRRLVIETALLYSYRNSGRWTELLSYLDQIQSSRTNRTLSLLRAEALLELGRRDAFRSAVESLLRDSPDDEDAIRLLASAAFRAGDGVEAARQLQRLIALDKATARHRTDLVWSILLSPALPPDAAERAREAAGKEVCDPERLRAAAAVLAAAGKPAEAIEILSRATGPDPAEPQPTDWLVLGKIYEDYGLLEDAAAAYAKLSAPKERDLSTPEAIGRAWAARLKVN